MIKTEKVSARTFEFLEDSIRSSGVNALVEGADAATTAIGQPTVRSNTTQIIGEAFKVAATVDAVKTHGRAKETAYALAKTLKAIKLDVEKALIGVDQAAVAGSASAARKMASVSQQISTTLDAGSSSTDPLTEAKLVALHQTCYTNGSEPTVLMIKPADATIVAGFATATGRNREIDAKTLINVIDVILTPFGELRTVINRSQLSTHAFLVDPSMFKQCVLRPFTRTLLAKNGDADTHFVVGEVSNKHVNYSDSGMITGLS
tara:strand:+ start:431 stop:1216 length:786 start_codon:yes stop_codon:yes gene_type:complete